MTKKATKQKKAATPKKKKAAKADNAALCPVIGIGASAGGLETLSEFLKAMPADSGVALVIVQHLDPNREALMAELLQNSTDMSVREAEDGIKVEPDHVYLIAPNKDMAIMRGKLHLFKPSEPKGFRLPIDSFFRSLAEDQKECAMGAVLSGMGSDGTMGIRAIKEQGGTTFVQDPGSAKFDGMPTSVVSDGFVDIIAPVGELPSRILSSIKSTRKFSGEKEKVTKSIRNDIEKILILLRSKTGHDFYQYKRNTILRRIERRMNVHQIDKITTYIRYLRENPDEIDKLFKELLIGVTNFFRDPDMWEYLKESVIPEMIKGYPDGGVLRAWIPGCSTGEEAYSLAMVFREVIDALGLIKNYQLQIFATELDDKAVDKARSAIYPNSIVSDVSEKRLRKFFVQEEMGWRIRPEIRENVIFAIQNVAMDPPFTKLDIVLCRNLLIYVEPALQTKIVSLFHYSLNPGGMLVLGSAETVGSDTNLFTPVAPKLRIYKRLDDVPPVPLSDFPTKFRHVEPTVIAPTIRGDDSQELESLADRVLLRHHSPAAVLTSSNGDILYVNGRTGKYLEAAEGKANWNILAMARQQLRLSLHGPFSEAVIKKRPTIVEDVIVDSNGGSLTVDVIIQPLSDPLPMKDRVLVVFKEKPLVKNSAQKATKEKADSSEMKALKLELKEAREHVQIINEEMQTSQEELKSSNEELQSTNEELQSTNEELTTSKEEMQSMNEELQTVNQELKGKIDDLSKANNDMKNLLDSTNIATLFLDEDLNVRRFTTTATEIFNLIPSDVGRPFTDITSGLVYPKMKQDALNVLDTLVYKEKAIQGSEGRWFLVRIMPYRTLDNRIDGLVITFADITESKTLERQLREKEDEALQLLDNMPKPFVLIDSVTDKHGTFVDGTIVFINSFFETATGLKLKKTQGKKMSEIWHEALPALEENARQVFLTGTPAAFQMQLEGMETTVQVTIYKPETGDKRLCLIFND